MSDTTRCVVCGEELARIDPLEPAAGCRRAYDLSRGRLWDVCPRCTRWNPVPLELRWETLEACERSVSDDGRLVVSSENLSLVRVGSGELIRVGEAPRVEFAGWRYGLRAPRPRVRGLWRGLLPGLPMAPLGGYDQYFGGLGPPPDRWVASPFMAEAAILTYAFTAIPFAPDCPSCAGPMLLAPWDFQRVRWGHGDSGPGVMAPCARCGATVFLGGSVARPAIRLGLSLVTGGDEARVLAEPAAHEIDQAGGSYPFVDRLSHDEVAIGEMEAGERIALKIALDEEAEIEALEDEWRSAEEIAAIMDGELTEVPGFEEFRQRVLGEGG